MINYFRSLSLLLSVCDSPLHTDYLTSCLSGFDNLTDSVTYKETDVLLSELNTYFLIILSACTCFFFHSHIFASK